MFHDWGNPPINSTYAPVGGGASTTTLIAELDSTRLGTNTLQPGQSLNVSVDWVFSSDTNAWFKAGMALSTGMGSTGWVDVMYPAVPALNSAQMHTRHRLEKDYRLRVSMVSSNAGNNSCFISAVVET